VEFAPVTCTRASPAADFARGGGVEVTAGVAFCTYAPDVDDAWPTLSAFWTPLRRHDIARLVAEHRLDEADVADVEDGRGTDVALAIRIASVAGGTIAGIDGQRCRLYLADILFSLSDTHNHEVLQVMNSEDIMRADIVRHTDQIARLYVAQGRAEGRIEGLVEILLRQLTLRFGPLAEAVQARVRGACYFDLSDMVEPVISAKTLEEALEPLSDCDTRYQGSLKATPDPK
jgi:hypothetical protein